MRRWADAAEPTAPPCPARESALAEILAQ